MSELDLSGLSAEQRPAGVWAAALLHALARDEAAGRWQQRLTLRAKVTRLGAIE
jgi:hypothetical protein